MSPIVPITFEDTNVEVLARIVKATSEKFDCTMEIDFLHSMFKCNTRP